MCDHPDKTSQDYAQEVLIPTIEVFGWAVQYVLGDRVHTPFAYTIGLTAQALPELVVTGLKADDSARILNTLGRHAVHKGPLRPGEQRNVCASDQRLEIVELPHPDAHLFVATGLFGPRVRALQLVWADDRGRWPWEVGHRGRQPVLGPRSVPWRHTA